MGTNWQQLGPVHAKVVGDKTLVTEIVSGSGWCVKLHTAVDSMHVVSGKNFAAEAMAAADAIYDPPPKPKKPIEAFDRGEYGSFWRSEDGKRAAWVTPVGPRWEVNTTDPDEDNDYAFIEEAELAAAKYVGGEG